MKKKIFFISFFCLFALAFAQNVVRPDFMEASWRYYLKAEAAYDEKNYAEAVKLAITAKTKRKELIDWELITLEQALKPQEVQKAGDEVKEILAVLQKREEYDAIDIIIFAEKKLISRKETVDVSQLKKIIAQSATYPEADFLLGKLYMLQGEYELSYEYLISAWKAADNLSVPELVYDILYETAFLATLRNDWDLYEKTLLLIIAQTGSSNGVETPFARSVKQALLRGTTVDRFFLMYRNEAFLLISAYNQLAEFYYKNNEIDKALSYAAIGSLSAFTRVFQAIKERNPEYVYTTFTDFENKVLRYADIASWSAQNNIWKYFYQFCLILRSSKENLFSRDLLMALAQNCPEDYWKQTAFKEIFNYN